MYVLDYKDIREILPHRYPMLLVDGVLSLEPNISIVAIKCVTGSELCYARLPEQIDTSSVAYPYSLILESFGQTGAILCRQSIPSATGEDVLMLSSSIKDCIFEAAVFPGDTMEHRVHLEKVIGDNAFLSGETWVEQQRIVRIESLVVALRPFHVLEG